MFVSLLLFCWKCYSKVFFFYFVHTSKTYILFWYSSFCRLSVFQQISDQKTAGLIEAHLKTHCYSLKTLIYFIKTYILICYRVKLIFRSLDRLRKKKMNNLFFFWNNACKSFSCSRLGTKILLGDTQFFSAHVTVAVKKSIAAVWVMVWKSYCFSSFIIIVPTIIIICGHHFLDYVVVCRDWLFSSSPPSIHFFISSVSGSYAVSVRFSATKTSSWSNSLLLLRDSNFTVLIMTKKYKI